MTHKRRRPKPKALTHTTLRRMPLPPLQADGDKEARGRVLAIGGSAATPGAILLAGVAALRAGAGKLQVATVKTVATALGVALPEAMVIALPQTRDGNIAGARAIPVLRDAIGAADALLIGPGFDGDRTAGPWLAKIIDTVADHAIVVLDAAAMFALRDDESMLKSLHGRAVLTPHAGEMATLLGRTKADIEANAADIATEAAARFGAIVALKGAESWIASPVGALFHYRGGSIGLATSGSGDTLAGIVAGLTARCGDPLIATCWGVWAHGTAGARLARRVGQVGFLARELLAEIPRLVDRA